MTPQASVVRPPLACPALPLALMARPTKADEPAQVAYAGDARVPKAAKPEGPPEAKPALPVRKARSALPPLHRQLRIASEDLEPFLELVDPRTRAVVRTIPLKSLAGVWGGDDLVVGGLDLVV